MIKKTARTSADSQTRTQKVVARGLLVAALTGGLAFATAMPASAAAGDTTTTFALTGGALSVAPQGTATLTNGASGAASVSGSLGATDVSDLRGSTAGWVVSAGSTTFTSGVGGSTSTGVSYNSGAAKTTGTVTATSAGATVIDAVAAVVNGTAASGNNTASFAPTLTVTLPSTALAGTYTGTVTTSIA